MVLSTRSLIITAIILVYADLLYSQISGNNLLEYQYGKIPGDSSAISTLYDRANIDYSYKTLRAGITLEQFYTGFKERNYIKPTQYFLQYTTDLLEIKAGSVYETMGRGLLLRSFEIPGAILEDLSYRSRHYFHRDILGLSTRFRHKNFSAKILYGEPLNNVYPPSQPESTRRTDIITAAYSEYTFGKQTAGASVLHLKNESGATYYGMTTLSGVITESLSYYTEFAKNLSDYSLSDFSDQASYAIYTGINLTFNNIGISAEYKNYKNFLLGAGINEPPALVKEHSYKVLNRSTHVLQPTNESGYQVEFFYMFADQSTLTLNNTIAVNDLNEKFVFQEYFTGYDFTISENIDIKLFADFAQDPFKLEMNRISTGAYFDIKTRNKNSVKADFEFQTFSRSGEKVQNLIFLLGYNYRSKLLVNVISEISNDPFLTEESIKTWLGTNLKYQINNKHNLLLFAGQRRGGPACNAGVCYEVLDFTGIEIRFSSRF